MWVLERGLIFSSLRLGSIALDFSKHVASLSLFNAAAQARLYTLLCKSASLRASGFICA